VEGEVVPDPELQTRPQFPSLNKHIRFVREAHEHYMRVRGEARFPPLPYWKLLTEDLPVAPVPIEPQRAPTAPLTEASDFPPGEVPLSDDLNLLAYPQPPAELHEVVNERTIVDPFGEAEWDRREFKAFVCPAFVKAEHSATLTKFGRVQKTEGEIHVSRFVLERIGLEPRSGDLFQWDGQLRVVVDAFDKYGRIGTSDYWTWLKVPYVDFHGDSSDLTLPGLPAVEVPDLPDEQ
jgi:hypothetical protein